MDGVCCAMIGHTHVGCVVFRRCFWSMLLQPSCRKLVKLLQSKARAKTKSKKQSKAKKNKANKAKQSKAKHNKAKQSKQN